MEREDEILRYWEWGVGTPSRRDSDVWGRRVGGKETGPPGLHQGVSLPSFLPEGWSHLSFPDPERNTKRYRVHLGEQERE